MKFIQIVIVSILISCSWTLDRNWWKSATIYEIFLKSFKDSNGDGIGDLKGITSKLDYFVDLGVDTIWITPFYPSSGADGGYDITDFFGIDPTYGTMEDFEELLKEMKIRGLNLAIDLVINHSSDEHEWFQKSIQKIEPYKDYYVWIDPKGYDENFKPIPPNNWVSMFNIEKASSSWTWNDQRGQFYFHHFGVKQPDFNLRNENLKKELKALMKFWLDKGVAAFRVDAVPFFMEDEQLREDDKLDKFVDVARGITEGFSYRLHHPDTFPFMNELYLYLRQYDKKNKKERETAMMAEAYGHYTVINKYFGTPKLPVTHFPFNFGLTKLRNYLNTQEMIDTLNIWLKHIPEGTPSNWALGNHDQGRIFNRFHNREYNYVLLTLVTMLPGASTIYYGEELTQDLFDFAPNSVRDLFVERDQFRTPMQWDNSLNAGFTSGEKPWVPVHPGYWYSNVEIQKSQQSSSLNYFKDLTSIRKTETSKFGDVKLYSISKWVLGFTRTYRGSKLVVLLNLGTESNPVNLQASINDLPSTLRVVAASPNSEYQKGEKFTTALNRRNFSLLRPHSAVVLTTD